MAIPYLYTDYGDFLRREFPFKVQKISINAGFTCPNRNGEKGWGGCTYCNNQTFNPAYCRTEKTITEQLEEGKRFFGRKYPEMKFLAYFQAYTNTYGEVGEVIRKYEEALAVPDVVGIVIGTRPDCMDGATLDLLCDIARDRYVAVEYGIESTSDRTLRAVNRGHDFAAARRAVRMTAERGLSVGGHFILGLPGETDAMLLEQTARINALPLTTVKFHQLQVFRGTAMAAEYDTHPERFRFWTLDEYLDLFVEILRRLRPDLVVERFASEAPPRYHYGRNWGLVRNEQLLSMLERRLEERDVWQGEIFTTFVENKENNPQ